MLLAALLLGAATTAQAQVSRFSIYSGFGLLPLHSTAPWGQEATDYYSSGNALYRLKTINTSVVLYTAGLSYDLPLLKLGSEEQALGISLNAALSITQASEEADGFNGQILLDFPQYVTWRYGAKATKHSQKTFGVGVGAGYRWARFFVPFNSPSAMVEGVYATPRHDWYLRLTADLRPQRFYNLYSSEGPVEVLRIREAGQLTLGRSF